MSPGFGGKTPPFVGSQYSKTHLQPLSASNSPAGQKGPPLTLRPESTKARTCDAEASLLTHGRRSALSHNGLRTDDQPWRRGNVDSPSCRGKFCYYFDNPLHAIEFRIDSLVRCLVGLPPFAVQALE